MKSQKQYKKPKRKENPKVKWKVWTEMKAMKLNEKSEMIWKSEIV